MRLVFKLEWAMTENAELIRIIVQNYINYFARKTCTVWVFCTAKLYATFTS